MVSLAALRRPYWLSERQLLRSLETVNRPKRTRKPGRPRLPRGQVKGKLVPVCFASEDLRAVEEAASEVKKPERRSRTEVDHAIASWRGRKKGGGARTRKRAGAQAEQTEADR
jgi:hypothetical protein